MTYNYFNAGRLAFGKKITAAFNSLNELCNSAEEHVSGITESVKYYAQFANKNYLCPAPSSLTMPARTNEIFDVISGSLKWNLNKVDDTITCSVIYFNNEIRRITRASGSSTMQEAYIIARFSSDLNNFETTLRFSEEDNPSMAEFTLFKYTVDDGKLFISEPGSDNVYQLVDVASYRSLSIGQVAIGSYTCNSRAECIFVRTTDESLGGYGGPFEIKLNGEVIFSLGSGQITMPFICLYLKRGDVITGTNVGRIYKVSYNL